MRWLILTFLMFLFVPSLWAAPERLACADLKDIAHTREIIDDGYGHPMVVIRGTLNGVEMFCGCSWPCNSCGLGIEPMNLMLKGE